MLSVYYFLNESEIIIMTKITITKVAVPAVAVPAVPAVPVPVVDVFIKTLAEFDLELTRSADLLVSVEKLEGDVKDNKAGISRIVWGVLISQDEPVLLGWHDAVRLSWGAKYLFVSGGKLGATAVDTAWSRVMDLLKEAYGYAKPRAETKEAVAKTANRAKENELIAALIAGSSVPELQHKAKALFNKAGDGGKTGKEALQQAKLITKAIDKANSEEANEAKEQLKDIKSAIKELLKVVDDMYILEEARDLLQGSADDMEADALL